MFNYKKAEPTEVLITYISPNPEQPRKYFDERAIEGLAESIRVYGVLQPIIVSKIEKNKYFIIAGERRYRAAKLAGCEKVPIITKNLDDKDVAIIALTENIQRENLNYFEEALAYSKLMTEHGLTQGEISQQVGKKQSTISNKIRLLALSHEIRQGLLENGLTERHARALLSLPTDQLRLLIIDNIVEQKLNIVQTEKLIKKTLEDIQLNKMRGNRKIKKIINYRIYINTLKQAFESIKEVSKDANYSEKDNGDFIEIMISIPKKTIESNKAGI